MKYRRPRRLGKYLWLRRRHPHLHFAEEDRLNRLHRIANELYQRRKGLGVHLFHLYRRTFLPQFAEDREPNPLDRIANEF